MPGFGLWVWSTSGRSGRRIRHRRAGGPEVAAQVHRPGGALELDEPHPPRLEERHVRARAR